MPCKSPNCSAASICRRLRDLQRLRNVRPVTHQILPDDLESVEVLRVHLEAFERSYLIQLEQQIASERVLNPALDEGDSDQPLAPCDRDDLVKAVRRVDDRFAGLQLVA